MARLGFLVWRLSEYLGCRRHVFSVAQTFQKQVRGHSQMRIVGRFIDELRRNTEICSSPETLLGATSGGFETQVTGLALLNTPRIDVHRHNAPLLYIDFAKALRSNADKVLPKWLYYYAGYDSTNLVGKSSV